jgi:hypothetical protein
MATTLIANFSVSNLSASLSHRSLRGIVNGNAQKLLNNISTNVNLGSGNYTYKWSYTGTSINFTNLNGSSTNSSHNSLSPGASSIYCTITDNNTGIQVTTESCDITWPNYVITPITSVTWSIPSNTNSTYNGNPQSVTVVSVTPADASYNLTTTSATNAGTVASTTLTGIGNSSGSFVSSNLTISKAVITITSSNASMTYRGSLPTFDSSPSGFIGSDTASVITGTVTHSTTGSSTANSGSYTITPIISGLSATNYSFSATNGSLTINKAVITITASNASMTYRGSLPTFGYSPSGFLGSDTASVITGTVTHSTTGSSTANSGSYTITPIISGLSATNYTFTPSNGTLTINKVVITITASNASMTYGNSLPTFVSSSSGFVNSETDAVITGTVTHSTTGTSSSNVGTYVITPSVSGLTATNYTFTPVNGILTINAAALGVSNTTGSATYNGSSQTVTVLSVINGTFSGSTSVSGTNAGSYTTTITGTGNYTGSVTGTLTINKAVITITASNASMTYSNSLPTFVSSSSGFLGSDNSSAINGTVTHSTTGSSSANAGSYTITPVVSGVSATNYTFTPSNGTLTINRATISGSAANPSLTYNGALQSGTVITNVLPSGATFTGSVTASGTAAGTYTSSITGSGNYQGTVNSGTFTINRATLAATETTSPYTIYNRASQSFTIGGINGTYSGNPTVSATNAGSYPTTITGTGNYIGSVTGILTIQQDSGYVDIFYGGVHDASRTTSIFVPVRTSNGGFIVTHSVSGPGYADAQHTSFGLSTPYDWNGLYDPVPPGAVVRNTNPYTQGFVVTITAEINDANYSFMSATTSVTVNAYSAPSSGGGITE